MKKTLSINHLSQSALFAVLAAVVVVALVFGSFMLAEPRITYGQSDTASFYIRQTITDETSFILEPANVVMQDTGINGISGGNATGTTQFAVRSNNPDGYYINIRFFDNAGPYAMRGDVDGDDAIRDYTDNAGEPTFGFTTQAYAQFAYTVSASTSADIDDSFKHTGGNCNQNGGDTDPLTCWKGPATTDFRIIDRTGADPTGATSTLTFKVNVPAGATPPPTAQTYTATATLSLFTNI